MTQLTLDGTSSQDKVYTPSANVPQCHELGKRLFSINIIHSTISPIQTILISTLLTQIHLERTGEIISRSAMRDVVDIMALLIVQEKGKRGVKSAYEVDFEPVFLRKSEEFYKEEAESSLQAFDASTYLRLVSPEIWPVRDWSLSLILHDWSLRDRSNDGYRKNMLGARHTSSPRRQNDYCPSSNNTCLRTTWTPSLACLDQAWSQWSMTIG